MGGRGSEVICQRVHSRTDPVPGTGYLRAIRVLGLWRETNRDSFFELVPVPKGFGFLRGRANVAREGRVAEARS